MGRKVRVFFCIGREGEKISTSWIVGNGKGWDKMEAPRAFNSAPNFGTMTVMGVMLG